jgi:hypothetical protein
MKEGNEQLACGVQVGIGQAQQTIRGARWLYAS